MLEDSQISPGADFPHDYPSPIFKQAWAQMSALQREAASLAWNKHPDGGIHPLTQPREQYIQKFTLATVLGYGEVMKNGEILARMTRPSFSKVFQMRRL